MKIPAIKANIGDWTYYISYMSFKEISERVEKLGPQIIKSTALSQSLQRAITENFRSISTYILSQEERFFNSLVLAVYNDSPNWVQVDISFKENEEYFNVGFLEYSGSEKIFPIDGQHRVEGIKDALSKNPELAEEKISILLVSHKIDTNGIQRSRRLFTTLNRYAKPVSLRDIIALDEDDVVAINTRKLIEEFPLFMENRIVDSKSKSIPESNKSALTSIITLYQCNFELFKGYWFEKNNSKLSAPRLKDRLRLRPTNDIIDEFFSYLVEFWNVFIESFDVVKKFMKLEYFGDLDENKQFRNSLNGGNLLFRPIALVPFVKVVCEIKIQDSDISYKEIIKKIDKTVSFQIMDRPWKMVLWNNKMIMNNQALTKQIFKYVYEPKMLKAKELKKLFEDYRNKLDLEDVKEAETQLNKSIL